MRLVLDTNVLIAAFISRGACADLFEYCVVRHDLVTSEFILEEVRRHLGGKFKFAFEDVEETIALLQSKMEVVIPEIIMEQVCRDADDDKVLGTAKAGRAQCIVTGDKDLLDLGAYQGMEIVRPSDFTNHEATTTRGGE